MYTKLMKQYMTSLELIKSGKVPLVNGIEAIEKAQKAVVKKLETETLFIRMVKNFYKVLLTALRNGASDETFQFMKLDEYDSRAFGATGKIRAILKEKTACKLFCKIDPKTRLPIELYLHVPEIPEEDRLTMIGLIEATEFVARKEAEDMNAEYKDQVIIEAVKVIAEERKEEASKPEAKKAEGKTEAKANK